MTSKIDHVTLFYQGAQITRTTSELPLAKGQHVISITGLEKSIQESSLRVGIRGKGRILNIVKSIDYLNELENSSKIEELKGELNENREKTEEYRIRIKVYEQERSFLLANIAIGGANTGVSVAQIREGAAFYNSRMMEIEQSLLDANRQIKVLEERSRLIQTQLAELNYSKNKPSGKLEVTVEQEGSGSCSLYLDYFVPEARWFPAYDFRIDKVGDPVKLVRKATAMQQTGEEWKEVSLTFSTANPTDKQQLPELYPWFVDILQPVTIMPVARTTQANNAKVYSLTAEVADDAEMEEETSFDFDMEGANAQFERGSKNSVLEYKLQTRVNLSSDGKEYSFSVGVDELEAGFHYQSVPKKEGAAFLIATINDWESYELTDGKANIYYENMFIGETWLSTSMMLDSLQLSMGKDQGLIIDRRTINEYTRTRTIGSNLKKSFGYEIIVRNTKQAEVLVILEDQLPIASNSQITVDAEELGGGKLEPSTGKVTWRVNVEPGATVKIPFRFSIRYPKEAVITL